MFYRAIITKTGATSPKKNDFTFFDEIVETFKNRKDLENYLENHYGKNLLENCNNYEPIYRDKFDNNGDIKETNQVGFTYHFWDKDWSHNTKAWWERDWIEIQKIDQNVEYPLNN